MLWVGMLPDFSHNRWRTISTDKAVALTGLELYQFAGLGHLALAFIIRFAAVVVAVSQENPALSTAVMALPAEAQLWVNQQNLWR